MKKKPILVTDIDGVVLRWNSMIIPFLMSQNYTITSEMRDWVINDKFFDLTALDKAFNGDFLEAYHSSKYGSELLPVSKEIIIILKELSKKYTIISLTAFSKNPTTHKNRIENLEKYFPKVFKEHYIIDPRDSKEESIRKINTKHEITLFIDDREKHIKEALEVLPINKVFLLKNYEDWNIIFNTLNTLG